MAWHGVCSRPGGNFHDLHRMFLCAAWVAQHCWSVSVQGHALEQPAKGSYNQVTGQHSTKPVHFICVLGMSLDRVQETVLGAFFLSPKRRFQTYTRAPPEFCFSTWPFSGLGDEKFVFVLKAVAWFYLCSDFIAFRADYGDISKVFLQDWTLCSGGFGE